MFVHLTGIMAMAARPTLVSMQNLKKKNEGCDTNTKAMQVFDMMDTTS